MAQSEILSGDDFSVGFSDREVTAWGGLAIQENARQYGVF